MLPRPVIFVCALLTASAASAQTYGNEWIEFNKEYYNFDVAVDGVYQIDSTTLANAGIPLSALDPRTIQIFGRGEQIPIYIEGESDGVFNGGDFIEFYATQAKGTDDYSLWEDSSFLANPHYNLINDTIHYFLSWDLSNTSPLRFEQRDSTNFTGFTESEFFWFRSIRGWTARYEVGNRDAFGATSPFMVEGEGWYDVAIQATSGTATRNRSWLTSRRYLGANAPDALAKVVWISANNPGGGQNDHHSVLSYNNGAVIVEDTIFSGYQRIEKNFTIPTPDLGNNSTTFRLQAVHDLPLMNFQPNYPDKQTLAFAELFYPRSWHMSNAARVPIEFVDEANGTDTYVEIAGVAGGDPHLMVFGPQNYRIDPINQGGWKARIPATVGSDTTKAFYYSTNSILAVPTLRKVNGTGLFTNILAAEEDSAMLIVTHESLMSGALQYAAYRNAAVNQYNTVVLDVEELYDQFGAGIRKHPQGIRGLVSFVTHEWSSRPRALFLIGKSIKDAEFNASDPGSRVNATAYARNLVPSFGFPSSDPSFVYNHLADSTDIVFPVGRISANTNAEVVDYMEKVQEFESNTEPEPWMKNILHFVGGTTANEQLQLSAFMDSYALLAQDTCFGGTVKTFKKFSSQVIQQIAADSINDLIEEGVTLMTFFAHASGSGFDISIDNPANYNWNGRYPMVIGNSCFTGNIHLTSNVSTSEQFVLPRDHGAIAFLASVDIGYADQLGSYSRHWYESFSFADYEGTIGEHCVHASEIQLGATGIRALNNVLTFTLQGDPTLVLNKFPRPEYSIDAGDVVFDPIDISTDVDSFQVNVRVVNSGKAIAEEVGVALERSVNGAQPLQPVRQVFTDELLYDDVLTFTVPVTEQGVGEGTNVFTARVDLDPQLIDEQSDELFNNQAQKTAFITSSSLLPIYPYEFAIVPESGPALKASTGDPFAAATDYFFEIDTTDQFNSPMLETTVINQVGGVVIWQPSSIYSLDQIQDSTVYYWRCSPDTVGNGGYQWRESSFQYITDREGWGQAHYFQFKNDGFNQIVYDRPNREFDFSVASRSISASVFGNSSGAQNNLSEWKLDGFLQDSNGCGATPALHVGVVDPATFEAWGTHFGNENPNNSFGNLNDQGACRQRVELYFIFRGNDQTQLAALENMLDNEVPNGHYVVVYSWRYLNRFVSDSLHPGAFDAIENLGGTNVRAVPDSVPYILIAQKGNAGFAVEEWGTSLNSFISAQATVPSTGNAGQISAPIAGPATFWDALYWDEKPSDLADSVSIMISGIDVNGQEVLLHEVEGSVDSIPDLETIVDAAVYPQVRLSGFFTDTSAIAQPSQLGRWQLLSSPVPEAAIDPNLVFVEELDSLSAGMTGKISVAIHNVSDLDMDSLLISAKVVKNNGQIVEVHYERHAPLPAFAVLADTISFSLLGMEGINTLIIEANPIDTVTNQFDQLEQYHFNNIAQLVFEVIDDIENPILDVTFDGLHILNGDVISAKPEILIQLDDENEILLLNSEADTANFKVIMTDPSGVQRQIFFRDGNGASIMEWIPATGIDNISQIMYRPNFEVDGTYRLIVQASDLSQNASGDRDFEVDFEVINTTTITDVVNYPNPFTTSTRFAFTLTGSEPPTYMKIQIMTISGRVVREITQDELGVIRVGKNLTDFAWDGRDQYGDRLGKGVYLYRVIAKINGEDIEYRETGASPFFKRGIGKMYLL